MTEKGTTSQPKLQAVAAGRGASEAESALDATRVDGAGYSVAFEDTGPRSKGALLVGRYEVHQCVAAGGMATVHLGRLHGAEGFSRTVAIKRLLPGFAMDPEFKEMFIQEGRLAARIQHANVASTLDVIAVENELLLVMEYIEGETLAKLSYSAINNSKRVPLGVISSVLCDALRGLHAAHEAMDRRGNLLGIIHRDISPQNIMVGIDGAARVLDFGIAKAADSSHTTREGMVRGKAAYMAPEQVTMMPLTVRADLYAVGVVLWELLTSRRLFPKGMRPELLRSGVETIESPQRYVPALPDPIVAVALRALRLRPEDRFQNAQEMARALEVAQPPASRAQVAEWVASTAQSALEERRTLVAQIELREPPRPISGIKHIPPKINHPARPAASSFPKLGVVFGAAGLLLLGLAAGMAFSSSSGAQEGDTATTETGDADERGPAASDAGEEGSRALAEVPEQQRVILNMDGLDGPTGEAEKESPAPTEKRVVSPVPRPRSGVHPKARPVKAQANCNPPFTVDAAGRKHYKAECF